jgi:hypothetical protein
VGLLRDAEVIYEAQVRHSPQDPRELAWSSGIDGERLQMAVVWLGLQSRAERRFKLDEELTRSFTWVRVNRRP